MAVIAGDPTHSRVDLVEVWIWNQRVGAVALDLASTAVFEYDRTWVRSAGIELAPLMMSLASARRSPLFSFPDLSQQTFRGLPGMLADALPDAFGNALIDAWMATHGVQPHQVTVLDKLAYMGTRGMGALEFRPPAGTPHEAVPVALQELVDAARSALRGDLGTTKTTQHALQAMIDVGTSAGGARAKAVVAWNPKTHEVRSGQFDAPAGFEHWLLKLDTGRDHVLGRGQQFGRIEYAYHRMALDAGVEMTPCRLLEENGRAHFMTQRFDRDVNSEGKTEKHHIQSLCALAHLDFNQVGTHSYEQLFMVADQLVGHDALQQIFARMCFNIVARNCDDHTKNFAFRLREGSTRWDLAPAYDVTHAYRPDSEWVSRHQLSVNGRFDQIQLADVLKLAERFAIERPAEIVERVNTAVSNWPSYARAAGVSKLWSAKVGVDHELLALAPGSSQTRRRLRRV